MTASRAPLLLTACSLVISCRGSHERERADFERMRLQQRYTLYAASPSFANGQSMQSPPAGTVSREALATVPIVVTPQLLARGKDRFTIYCAVCHGAGGFGGSLVAENMGQPRPPSLRSQALLTRPVEYIFTVATAGKGRMPAYAPQLTASDRWAVASYVHALQSDTTRSTDDVKDSLMAEQIARIDSAAAAAAARRR